MGSIYPCGKLCQEKKRKKKVHDNFGIRSLPINTAQDRLRPLGLWPPHPLTSGSAPQGDGEIVCGRAAEQEKHRLCVHSKVPRSSEARTSYAVPARQPISPLRKCWKSCCPPYQLSQNGALYKFLFVKSLPHIPLPKQLAGGTTHHIQDQVPSYRSPEVLVQQAQPGTGYRKGAVFQSWSNQSTSALQPIRTLPGRLLYDLGS